MAAGRDASGAHTAAPRKRLEDVQRGTNNEEPDRPAPAEYAAVLKCFREDDGKLLFQRAWPALKGPLFRLGVVGFASSPLIEQSRMYFTSTRGEVVCWDIGAIKDRNE